MNKKEIKEKKMLFEKELARLGEKVTVAAFTTLSPKVDTDKSGKVIKVYKDVLVGCVDAGSLFHVDLKRESSHVNLVLVDRLYHSLADLVYLLQEDMKILLKLKVKN